MSKPENLPGNDSIRPGQLDPGPLTKEHIKGALERLRKQGTTPLLGSAIVYETTYYSLAADMYKEVIRGLESGKVFEDKHTPGRVVKGMAVCMGYIHNIHIIEVYGVIEKSLGVEP